MEDNAKMHLEFSASDAVADSLQSLAIESLDPGVRAPRLAASYGRGTIGIEAFSTAIDALDEQQRSKI